MIRRKYNLLSRATPRTTPWLPWTPSRSPKGSTAADVCALFADASNEIKVMNDTIFICHVTRCQCLTRYSRVPRHNIIRARFISPLSLFLFLYGDTRNQISKQLSTENKSPDRIRYLSTLLSHTVLENGLVIRLNRQHRQLDGQFASSHGNFIRAVIKSI